MEIKEKKRIKMKKKDENNEDKKTDTPYNNKENKELEHIRNQLPIINIRKISTLSDSVINYFVISISLFIYSAYNLDWFDLKNSD